MEQKAPLRIRMVFEYLTCFLFQHHTRKHPLKGHVNNGNKRNLPKKSDSVPSKGEFVIRFPLLFFRMPNVTLIVGGACAVIVRRKLAAAKSKRNSSGHSVSQAGIQSQLRDQLYSKAYDKK